MEIGEGEGVFVAVELEEEIIGTVALVLGEGRGVIGGGEDGEEVRDWAIHEAGTVDGAAEEVAEIGGCGFAMVKVGGDEAREGFAGFGDVDGFSDAVRVGLEDLGQDMAVVRFLVVFTVVVLFLFLFKFDVANLRERGLNHGENLVEGMCSDGEIVFTRDIWACGWSVLFGC